MTEVVVVGDVVLGLLAHGSLVRSCGLGVLVSMMTEVVVVGDVVLGLLAHGSLVRSCGLGVLAAMVTEVSFGVFPMHVSAACVCTVPDVDACAVSPLGDEFEKFFVDVGAPLDKEIGSDTAGRHPASPLVASALDAIIRGNRVREWGLLLVVFSVASLSRSCGEGVLVARTSSMMAGGVDALVAAIGVLRSCCWPGFGLLGVVTEVGWKLGVP